MSFRETVTLQIGNYANYVGAHYWNIQESSFVYDPRQVAGPKEVCHDVLFREGFNPRKEVTFTPRLVAFDLKGSLKTLKQEGSLYEKEQEEDEVHWLGDVTMHREPPAAKNSFLQKLDEEGGLESSTTEQDDKEICDDDKEEETTKKKKIVDSATASTDLNTTVTAWSDFLRTHYHPKSIHIVQEFRHLDKLQPFDIFNCADEVFSNYEATCEWEDRIRYFAEECDHLQGFQVFMDTHDGFGGLGAGVLKHLEEDYPSKGVLTFGFTPSDMLDNTASARAMRIINSALAYDKACVHSSLFVPASLASGLWRTMGPGVQCPHLTYNQTAYHTSAILGSAIETLSLPYRLETGACHMRDITHTFNMQSRKMASIHTSIPLGLHVNESLVDYFSNLGDSLPCLPLTPHMTGKTTPLMQSVVLRGVKDDQVKSTTDPRKLPDHMVGCGTVTDTLNKYLDKKCPNLLCAKTCLQASQKTLKPFPHIFNENVSKRGQIMSGKRREDLTVDEIPMMTSLQCNTEIKDVVEHLHNAASKMNIKKHHRYIELGLEEDDFVEVLDNLKQLAFSYKTETEGL